MADAPEIRALKGKVNVLSTVLRLGHEAFRRHGLSALATHIVNNSRLLARFDRSALVDLRAGHPRVLAVMGMAEADNNTEYALNLLKLAPALNGLAEKTTLTEEGLRQNGANEAAVDALADLHETASTVYALPMRDPAGGPDGPLLLWIVEFVEEPQPGTDSILQLLAETYNNALWNCIYSRRRVRLLLASGRRAMSPGRVFLALLIVFLLAMVFGRIRQNVAADFEIVPQEKEILYAPFEGIISRAMFRNGARVKPGDAIMKYNTEELEFRLSDARASFDETSAKLDLVRRNAFTDNTQLGQIKLLAIQKEKEQINIDRMQWYLDHSVIKAGCQGTLVIDDDERWDGKAVKTGDRLAEIYPPGQLIASVMLNEKDASVLGPGMSISLYLHTRPESPLKGKVLSISPKPLLQKNNQYCYVIRITLEDSNLIFGMRGVARVSGPQVSLGYYLFRNLVLWWRKF